MKLNQKTKKILWLCFAAALIAVFAAWMILDPPPEHIEDTNGADDFTLQTVTEEDVVDQRMGTRGAISKKERSYTLGGVAISDGIKYSSRKFTGVYSLCATTLFKGSDICVDLAEFKVNKGNFAFYVVFDGEIIGQITPNESGLSEFRFENAEKTAALEYVIAGESADFEFTATTEF